MRREAVQRGREVHRANVDTGVLKVHEPGDDTVLHERVAEREVPVRDLPRQRGVDGSRELARAVHCAVKKPRLRDVEARVFDRLPDVVDERMDAFEVALEPRRPVVEVAELSQNGVKPCERGGSRLEVRAAVLWQRLALDAREEDRRSAIHETERVCIRARDRSRHPEGQLGESEPCEQLMLETPMGEVGDVRIDLEDVFPGGAADEEGRVLVALARRCDSARTRKAPSVEDRVEVAGRIHGCVPLSMRLRSSVSSWNVECSMSKSPRRHVARSSRIALGSAPRFMTTWAEMTFIPLVIVHTWRSWMSTTPLHARTCSRRLSTSTSRGVASRSTS